MSILHQFRGNQGGFGLQSYNRARAAGINPIHIANAIGSSGMALGWRARDAIIRDSAAQAFSSRLSAMKRVVLPEITREKLNDINRRLVIMKIESKDSMIRLPTTQIK